MNLLYNFIWIVDLCNLRNDSSSKLVVCFTSGFSTILIHVLVVRGLWNFLGTSIKVSKLEVHVNKIEQNVSRRWSSIYMYCNLLSPGLFLRNYCKNNFLAYFQVCFSSALFLAIYGFNDNVYGSTFEYNALKCLELLLKYTDMSASLISIKKFMEWLVSWLNFAWAFR